MFGFSCTPLASLFRVLCSLFFFSLAPRARARAHARGTRKKNMHASTLSLYRIEKKRAKEEWREKGGREREGKRRQRERQQPQDREMKREEEKGEVLPGTTQAARLPWQAGRRSRRRAHPLRLAAHAAQLCSRAQGAPWRRARRTSHRRGRAHPRCHRSSI